MKFSIVASAALATTVSAFPTFNLIKARCDDHSSSSTATATATYGGYTYAASSTATATGSGSASSSTSGSSSGSGSASGSTSGAVTDTCDIGYCTQNGGTTGGSTGEQTTVTTLDDLKTAASADGAAIIIVDGEVSFTTPIKLSERLLTYSLPLGLDHWFRASRHQLRQDYHRRRRFLPDRCRSPR